MLKNNNYLEKNKKSQNIAKTQMAIWLVNKKLRQPNSKISVWFIFGNFYHYKQII